MSRTVRVVYVMGFARSGSTLLDTFLGNHPDCVGVGELIALTRRESGAPEYCSCGRQRDDCAFWQEVLDAWKQECGAGAERSYARLQPRFERFRRWPAVLAAAHRPGSAFGDFSQLTAALYRAISRISGKAVVADSSKYPVRAFGLSRMPGIQLILVHLVRDPRAVVWSFKRRFSKDAEAGIQRDFTARPAYRTALDWLLTSLQAEFVASRAGQERYAQVRYEDFVADPSVTGTRLGALVGLDLSDVVRQTASGTLAGMPHAIAGNRMRMRKEIVLRPDLEWRERLSSRDTRTVERLCRLVMKRYDYSEV